MAHDPLDTGGLPLELVLFDWPDEPLPNIAGFDRIASADQAAWLMQWIEAQRICNIVIRHHGHAGLLQVTGAIARACSKFKVPMRRRVRSVAMSLGLQVY